MIVYGSKGVQCPTCDLILVHNEKYDNPEQPFSPNVYLCGNCGEKVLGWFMITNLEKDIYIPTNSYNWSDLYSDLLVAEWSTHNSLVITEKEFENFKTFF